MNALYNEIEPYAAQWLSNLIERGHIAPGRVDTRSIVDLKPSDVAGPGQRHFFAGIGGWSYALRLAGIPDDADVWTGSCPCQPFSDAGKGLGVRDPRHLWPTWFRLIRECRPPTIFGEQVASKDGLAWLDLVRADLEGCGYAVGASDLCAAGIGAPHIRQRLYFVAHAGGERREGLGLRVLAGRSRSRRPEVGGAARLVVDASSSRSRRNTGGLSDAQAQGEGERRWARRLLDESRNAGPDRYCTNCGSVHRIGTQCGRVGHTTLDEFSRSARCREMAGEETEGATGVDCGHRVEHASSVVQLANRDGEGRTGPQARKESTGLEDARRSREFNPWSNCEWLSCTDGVSRPVEPGTFPLAHGVSGRVGRLRGYGNAIVPQVAACFIEAAFAAWSEVK